MVTAVSPPHVVTETYVMKLNYKHIRLRAHLVAARVALLAPRPGDHLVAAADRVVHELHPGAGPQPGHALADVGQVVQLSAQYSVSPPS